jgi:hypothetical protein
VKLLGERKVISGAVMVADSVFLYFLRKGYLFRWCTSAAFSGLNNFLSAQELCKRVTEFEVTVLSEARIHVCFHVSIARVRQKEQEKKVINNNKRYKKK